MYESDSEQTGFPDDELFQDLVKRLSEDRFQQKDWEECLRVESDDAWLALALAQLPNLERLNTQYCEWSTRWVALVVECAASRSPSVTFGGGQPVPLQRLQTVTLRKNKEWDTDPLTDTLSPFLWLPSV